MGLDCWHWLRFLFLCHLFCGLRLTLTLCYNDTNHTHTMYTNTHSERAEAIWQVTGLHNWPKQERVRSCVSVKARESVRRRPFLSVATTPSIIMQQMSLLSLLWSPDRAPAATKHHACNTHTVLALKRKSYLQHMLINFQQ